MKAKLHYIEGKEWSEKEFHKEIVGVDLIAETNDEDEALQRFIDKGIKISNVNNPTEMTIYFNDLAYKVRRFGTVFRDGASKFK